MLLLALPVLLVLAQDEPLPPETPSPQSLVRELRAAATHEELAARDARLTFSAASAERARALLEAAPDDERARALAVIALGASRSLSDLRRIESLAADGGPVEKKSALLALGDLGNQGARALERLARADTSGNEEALVLARIHALGRGASACVTWIETLATQESELGLTAKRFADYARGGEPPGRAFALEAYYELRWQAACTYGFVDGRRWQKVLLDDLLRDEEFLDRVVLGAAVELDLGPVRDHLYEILLEGGRPGAVRAAAAVMPVDLARLIEREEWRPASIEEWRAMLEEIDERRGERGAVPLLELAFAQSEELQPLAGLLLLRSGENLPWKWVANQITAGPVELRTALVLAAGDRADPERIPDLVGLITTRPELGLLGAGLVALARLDDRESRAELERLVRSGPSEERTLALRALAQAFHDRGLLVLGQIALARDDLEPELRFELELGLARNVRSRGSESLAAQLSATKEAATKIRIVRALATRAAPEDLAKLRELFPIELPGESEATVRELDVALALALVRARDPAALVLLRAALWNDSWNRSVLAGGLLERAQGVSGLADELEAPPPGSGTADLRRVGFAIGEWGGLSAVDLLARRRVQGDPALQGALLGALAARAH